MRSSCRALVLLGMLSACKQPEVAKVEPRDVWRGLRWDMTRAVASQTLARQGLKVVEQGPLKSPETYLSIDAGGWNATVYFNDDGKMNQIAVTTRNLTKEAVAAAQERLTKRFGSARETTSNAERSWGAAPGTDGTGPWVDLFVVDAGDEGWIAREDYRGGESGDPVGAFDLSWGQPAPAVEQRLRAAGFEARTTAMVKDPCLASNAPPGCEPGSRVIVPFKRGRDEGTATVHKTRGLETLTYTASAPSLAAGLARAQPIQARFGPPVRIVDSTIARWSHPTTDVSLDVRRETRPENTLAAIEEYLPPGSYQN